MLLLEKTPESPLDYKEIQPVHPEGDKSWVFIGRTDIEAETPLPGEAMVRGVWRVTVHGVVKSQTQLRD